MSRLRRHTPKAMEAYIENRDKYQSRLDKQWSLLETLLKDNQSISPATHRLTLLSVRTQVMQHYTIFDSIGTEFSQFLHRAGTEDSFNDLTNLTAFLSEKRKATGEFLDRVKHLELEMEQNTIRSGSSRSQQAKLNAARAKAAYAEEVAKLERSKIILEEKQIKEAAEADRKKKEIEIQLKVLKEREALAVQEAELEEDDLSLVPDKVLGGIPIDDPGKRTADYVEKETKLNVGAPPFVPTYSNSTDLTKFLMKKDLLMSRLAPFNDQPENFISWRETFKSVVTEIGANHSEEIDLLVKWLGQNSRRQALSLKTAYISNPELGLSKVWERLEERFGTPERVYHSTIQKLSTFPRISGKNPVQLYDLSDILSEIEGLKCDPKFTSILAYFDAAIGINPIVCKLPYYLQEKWTSTASIYKQRHNLAFPPFSEFAKFIREQSQIRNDPSFHFENPSPGSKSTPVTSNTDKPVLVKKTNIPEEKCPIHKTPHRLQDCRVFREMSNEGRRKFLSDKKLCFKCYSGKHIARECVERSNGSNSVHDQSKSSTGENDKMPSLQNPDSGEDQKIPAIKASCTEVCNSENVKSCSKILLVNVFSKNNKHNRIKCYCIIDEQSNRSLIKPELFSKLQINGEKFEYLLKTCNGSKVVSGRRATDIVVESLDSTCSYDLPTLLECSYIPNDKNEICRPENARHHSHLKYVADKLPEYDVQSDILLLLGRDVIEAHHVFDQVLGSPGMPFAQQLGLGWVVVGEMCLGQIHVPTIVNVNKTYVLDDGRTSLFKPCCGQSLSVQDPLFVQTPNDNKVALSQDDREFLNIMDKEVYQEPDGGWVAPLPLRSERNRLPNNRSQVLKRTNTLLRSLHKDPIKKSHFFELMEKILKNGHAELAPSLSPGQEVWYLPIFGVYHKKKVNQVRVVFDSSAKFEGVSLNSVLLQGPDLTNNLIGVLMRFRRDQIAVLGDIEQMFYSFSVVGRDRNLLRFLWFLDNDPSKELVEYCICRHVFGNSPSPTIATYCLRKSVKNLDHDVRKFVERDFYVDDGLSSRPSVEEAVDLLKRTQIGLKSSKLRLHKIASNDPEVLRQFPVDDLAKGLKDVDLYCGHLPDQRSLGIVWNIENDKFMFKVDMLSQPITKRGILSAINSLFDPLGFLAPVVLQGRLILRELVSSKVDWDEPIPTNISDMWKNWRQNLVHVENLSVGRSYFKGSLSVMSDLELHIFSDASVKAISSVAYVLGRHPNGAKQVGFVLGKSKLAPEKGHSVPRLELCAAVLASQLFQSISEQIDFDFTDSNTKFYTDSKVVLGYLCNKTRRFYQYVSNRVQKILQCSKSEQWLYVPSHLNPADIGSRGASVHQLISSCWLKGPQFLCEAQISSSGPFPLILPEDDTEIRPEVLVSVTNISDGNLFMRIIGKFSSFDRLVRAISTLKHIAISFHQDLPCKGWHLCSESKRVKFRKEVKQFLFQSVQKEVYSKELEQLTNGKATQRDSSILALNPTLGTDGLIHVGGRLSRSKLPLLERHPIILPGKHHLSRLLVEHYHNIVHHQGRLFTEGALRSAGFWITGSKRLVSSIIYSCVVCRRLRGRFEYQKMSDLPMDRVEQVSPFSYVGVDVFGPWEVVARRTRGGQAASKRWAVLFTCLTIRAVHIEVIEELSSSSFTNALRRFVSVRGNVKMYRSDRGTNFVGAIDNIGVTAINIEDGYVQEFLRKSDSVWVFNSPHSSHMGGVWERLIGVSRRILEAMLLNVKSLTHEVLVTLMAEVSAVINSRPIVPISYDPEVPEILSPSSLLTQKLECERFPCGNVEIKDMYKSQWKQVQYLANQFWIRWRKEYLQNLQCRKLWPRENRSLKVGDIVLLKDVELARNLWPMAKVTRVFPSRDGRIRKVEICVTKDGKKSLYTRPVVDLVLLVQSES